MVSAVSVTGTIQPPILISKKRSRPGSRSVTPAYGKRWRPWATGSLWTGLAISSTTSTATSTRKIELYSMYVHVVRTEDKVKERKVISSSAYVCLCTIRFCEFVPGHSSVAFAPAQLGSLSPSPCSQARTNLTWSLRAYRHCFRALFHHCVPVYIKDLLAFYSFSTALQAFVNQQQAYIHNYIRTSASR
jgi:hypothetical protein